LAGDDPILIKFGPKGIDPQQEGCTLYQSPFARWHRTQRAVHSVIADLLVLVYYNVQLCIFTVRGHRTAYQS